MHHWRIVYDLTGVITAFIIPPLLPQNSYAGPSGNDDNDLCKCNTVLYNLISACDACQGSPWTTCVDSSLFSSGFQPIDLLQLVTLRGRPTVLRQQAPEREPRIVSTGLYV